MSAVPSPLPEHPALPAGQSVPATRAAARPDPLYHTVILVICVGVMILSLLLSVREERQVLVPLLGTPLPELCLTKRWTGVGCPGCGMTRSFISLGHGDVRAALHYNPAGPLLFAMLAVQIPIRLVQLVRIRRGLPELRFGWLPQVLFGVLGVVMVGQWILRQLGVTF
jgi:hypothetical protein